MFEHSIRKSLALFLPGVLLPAAIASESSIPVEKRQKVLSVVRQHFHLQNDAVKETKQTRDTLNRMTRRSLNPKLLASVRNISGSDFYFENNHKHYNIDVLVYEYANRAIAQNKNELLPSLHGILRCTEFPSRFVSSVNGNKLMIVFTEYANAPGITVALKEVASNGSTLSEEKPPE